MAVFVDFVGLNTLVEEPIDVNTNTVGGFIQSKARGPNRKNAGRGGWDGHPETPAKNTGYGPFPKDADGNPIIDAELRNTSIQTINSEDYLAALNLHRNGPYGYPIFKQLRAGQSPIIRRQRLTNIFSHYEFPGQTLTFETGRNTRNFTLIRLFHNPAFNFNADQTTGPNSTLVITIGGTSYTVEFDAESMDTVFDGSNKMKIGIFHSDIISLRSDHDRVKLILDKIASAIRALNLPTIGRVITSSSNSLYRQAYLYIEAKAFGSDGVEVTSTYNHVESFSFLILTYLGALSSGDSVTLHESKVDKTINFVSGNDQDGIAIPTDTEFTQNSNGAFTANINIDTVDTQEKTATAVKTLINSLATLTAEAYAGTTNKLMVKTTFPDKNNVIKHSEVDSNNRQTFSDYVHPGAAAQDAGSYCRVVNNTATEETISRVVPQRRGPVEHFNEVPVVSRHKPLRMIGSVTTLDPDTNKDVLERVEVYTTLGNETTHFSNGKLNKFYGTEGYISEDYENFVDLYLEGGVDGDESPIDEFRYLSYKQVVYPKEIYTYKNHTRNRINFISRYWRDARKDRTETDVDNGFGFNVFSQSAWVLDGEQNFKDLTFLITPGVLTMRHPNLLLNKVSHVSGAFTTLTASTETFTFPDSRIYTGPTAKAERAISLVNLGDSRLSNALSAARHYSPIAGLGGGPSDGANATVPVYTGGDPNEVQVVAINPWDIGVEALHRYTVAESDNLLEFTSGLRKAFEKRGYKLGDKDATPATEPQLTQRLCKSVRRDPDTTHGMQVMLAGNTTTDDAAARAEWRLKTTSSTISTWLLPNPNNIPAGTDASLDVAAMKSMFLSGTLYHETVTVTPIEGGDSYTKLSKVISFDPEGGVVFRLGTVFSASANQAVTNGHGRLVYIGADEPGAVMYKTADFYGVDNPIYKSALSWNKALAPAAYDNSDKDIRKAKFIAATSVNHFLAELNLSGSEPQLGLASTWSNAQTASYLANRGELFQQKHAHDNTDTGGGSPTPLLVKADPNGYARVYVNASSSAITTRHDPYKFLSGSQSRLDGSFQEQLVNRNSSLKLKNITSGRDASYLSNTNFVSLSPFNSQGFSFSYWIKFGEDPEGYGLADNLIFSIQDKDGNTIIDHSIGGSAGELHVNFKNSDGNLYNWYAERQEDDGNSATTDPSYYPNDWYNVTFTLRRDGANMVGDVKVFRKNEKADAETSNWTGKAFTTNDGAAGDMTYAAFAKIKDSKKLYVLPAGASFIALRDNAASSTALDNVNLDGLMFWNGGLTNHQMTTVLSGSDAAHADMGFAGSAPPAAPGEEGSLTALYPASDTSIALQSVSSPTFRHGRRLHEMNTYRWTSYSYDGGNAQRGINANRGDRYYPLGNNFTAKNFQDNVLDNTDDGAVEGEMSYSFWFRATHQNYRNRSLRYQHNSVSESHPMTFNSNIGNRSQHHKGFIISFWMRRNGPYDEDGHTNIISGANNRWGICVTPDGNWGDGYGTAYRRNLALWFESDPLYSSSKAVMGASGEQRQMMFMSTEKMPNDDEWHHCIVQWNGKVGLECSVFFSIDGSRYAVHGGPNRNSIPEPTNGIAQNGDVPFMTLRSMTSATKIPEDGTSGGSPDRSFVDHDYQHGVNIINPAPTAPTKTSDDDRFKVYGMPLRSRNMNIRDIVVIEDAPDFATSQYLHTQLYNTHGPTHGQRAQITQGTFGNTNFQNQLELTQRNYGGGYIHPYNNSDAKIKNANTDAVTGLVWLRVNQASNHNKYSYNFGKSRMFWAYVSETYKPYFQIVNENAWSPLPAAKAGGWTVTFNFQMNSDDANTFRDHDNYIVLLEGTDSDNDLVFRLIKMPGNSHQLRLFFRYSDDTFSYMDFNGIQSALLDGDAHTVIFTTHGSTNSAGRLYNTKMFIDGEEWSHARGNITVYTSGGATNKAIDNTNDVKTLTLFAARDGSYTIPADFRFSSVQMYRQYLGGDDSFSEDARFMLQKCTISGDSPSSTVNRPAIRCRDLSGALVETTITGHDGQTTASGVVAASPKTIELDTGYSDLSNVKFLPAVVDCPLAGGWGGSLGLTANNMVEIPVRNFANRNPTLAHHYEFARESELANIPLFDRIKKPVLPNFAKNAEGQTTNCGTLLTGSNKMIVDSGPRHWNVDWYGYTGGIDLETMGRASTHSLPQQWNQRLFFIGDERNDASPRTVHKGIELYLSASGGGYSLVSAIGRSTDEVKRSAENLIIPDRWYHVYGSYRGCRSGGIPSATIYLNGEQVSFTNIGGTPAGGFDVLASTKTAHHVLTVGGAKGGVDSNHNFSGFIQDFALWNNAPSGDAETARARICENTWDGIREGSTYINTATGNNLVVATKMGFYEGGTNMVINKVAGYQAVNGTMHDGFASHDRAFTTGPPINWWGSAHTGTGARQTTGATVVSFWCSLANRAVQGIIGFNSDAQFNKEFYLEYGDPTYPNTKAQMVNYTDTSPGAATDNSTFRRLRLKLEKLSAADGGSYRLSPQMVGIYENNTSVNNSRERADWLHLDNASPIVADGLESGTPALGTLFHNTVIIEKDAVIWYVNGELCGTTSIYSDITDQSNILQHLYPRGSESTQRHFINGWNNITVLDETQEFKTDSMIDEVAVLFYPTLGGGGATAGKLALAQELYNGGSIFDFSGKDSSLYAWWRMGENVMSSTPLTLDTNVSRDQRIDDESSRGSFARSHLFTLQGGSIKAVERTGAGGSDLKNYYSFTATELDNTTIPYGKFSGGKAVDDADAGGGIVGGGLKCAINGTNQQLTVNGNATNWEYDYSFDSYKLYPFGWLATEGVPADVYIQGKNTNEGGTTDGTTRLRFGIESFAETRGSRPAISDFAIFTGTSHNYSAQGLGGDGTYDTTSQTYAVTKIRFGSTLAASKPSVGDVIVLIVNPRKVAGGGPDSDGDFRELRILFVNDASTDVNFSTPAGPWTSRPNVKEAKINIISPATDSVLEIVSAMRTLINNELGSTHTATVGSSEELVITSDNPGGDGKWEIVGKYEGQGQDNLRCKITTVVGASHISSALTRKPGHGWVQMNDSAFSRGTYANTFVYDASLNKSGSRGLLPTMDGSTPVIKPYWYALETKNDGVTVGNYETNIGLSAGKFNIKNTLNHVPNFENYTGYGNIDSGSTVVMTLDNTPLLDFNDIRIHTGSFFTSNISSSTIDLATPRAPTELVGGSTGARAKFGPGLLQNSYNQFAQQIVQGPTQFIDPQLSASACYFRRHSLTASTSFVSPSSGFLEKLSASHNAESPSTFLIGNMSASHLFLGSAKWEAGDFAGTFDDTGTFKFKPKKPFFDNYGAFIEEARPLMKDYGIVPEFRISEHINSYLTKGTTEQKLDFLNITGGLESADTSNKQNFYEIYSTSDFLKHFELVQEDHSDFVDPFAIRLRCSVVKKFLPYEGFYPAQRTVQVAQQFYRSYGDNITVTASLADLIDADDPSATTGDGIGETKRYDLSANNNYGVQYLLNPLFSPGIMFNTIKSGVAVDYPLITDTGSVRRADYLDSDNNLIKGGSMISEQFDTRIPFEALLEPEKHLANITLASNEPDENGRTDIEVEWGGQGDQLYNLMVSNFLAETSEFFLENKSFTSLASLSQGDPNFGNAQKGNIYMMRLKMFRSTTGKKSVQKNRLSKSYGVPQDQGAVRESFTMYSRPSAFGPPQFLSGSGFTANTWSDFKFDGTSGSIYIGTDGNPFGELKPVVSQHDFSYVTGSTYGYETTTGESGQGGHEAIGNRAAAGYNYPFTPPYYHGEAWADITFIPTESKKYTLQEIINQSSVEFYRYFAGAGTLKPDGFTPVTHEENIEAERVGDILHDLRGDGTADNPNREGTLSNVHDRTVVINDQAMQIASSVNIFSQGVLEQDISTQIAAGIKSSTQVQVDTDISNKYRWIIQTKFETPMLNFNKYTYGKHTNPTARAKIAANPAPTDAHPNPNRPVTMTQPDPTADGYDGLPLYTDNTYGIELPGVGPMQTPIGMWHQYGHLPQNTKEGVFLQVDDVPKSWIANAMHREPAVAKRHKSLATLCGFSTDPVRMGEVAGVKEISEAVVAIPFFEKAGRRRFFTMNRRQIRLALDPARKNLVGRTIVDMVEKMKKFVIPPQLDFVANDKIRPFSMYIFEFNHNLTKQDLGDIWQNLPPKLHQTVETDEVSISHQLLAYELLGRGGNYRRGRNQEVELIRNDRAESVNPEIQWMVFKVKQKAKTNYFEKIFARNESQQILSQRLKLGVSADALGRKRKISYNWPYDFFSMIEGVKINAEVHFLDFDEEASQAQEKPVVKPKVKTPTKSREKRTAASRRLLGAVSGKVPPDKLKKTAEEADKKPKTKKGKITRMRRTKTVIKKPDTRKKKLNNAFDRKKIK